MHQLHAHEHLSICLQLAKEYTQRHALSSLLMIVIRIDLMTDDMKGS